MASCPNCEREIQMRAATCEFCGAMFEGPTSWKPVPQTEEERVAVVKPPAHRAPVPARVRPTSLSMAIAVTATGVYLYSLFLPALLFERSAPLSGYKVLMLGWLGLLQADLAWYANPLLFFAFRSFLKGYPGRAAALGFVALALGATAPLARLWWFSEAVGTKILALGEGYGFWMASIALFICAALVSLFRRATALREAL